MALARASWGCSSYIGTNLLDATVDGAGDAATDRVTVERAPAVEVCGKAVPSCDPLTQTPCEGGLSCVITTLLPPTAICAAAGPRGLGQACDATVPSTRCGRGLQCLAGRCLYPCCARDDARCQQRNARSACAVFTESETLFGCTLPGACSYRPQADCAEGELCFPQSEYGAPICRPVRGNPLNARCKDQNDCTEDATCMFSRAGAGFGACRPMCNPRDQSRCAMSRCTRLYQRPADFGACE